MEGLVMMAIRHQMDDKSRLRGVRSPGSAKTLRGYDVQTCGRRCNTAPELGWVKDADQTFWCEHTAREDGHQDATSVARSSVC